MSQQHKGMTLIELLVVMAVIGITFALALPNYRIWTQNMTLRNAAESIKNGLQLARSESVKRNAPVQFQLIGGNGGGWQVCSENAPGSNTFGCAGAALIQQKPALEGGNNVAVFSNSVPGTLTTPLTTSNAIVATYTGLGRLQAGGTNIARIDVRRTGLGTEERNLIITLSNGGSMRMCDPKLNITSDPRGC